MRKRLATFAAIALVLALAAPARADDYVVDGVHAGITFKIQHVGLSYIFGRFNSFSGNFTVDPDPAKCAFAMTIKAESIDTANAQRDNHLKSPDFFNAKQFPMISFQSSSVKAVPQGYEVTGDMTMHGVTKPVTFVLSGGKSAEFPRGVKRTGFSTDFVLKRSDFGVGAKVPPEAAGDDVHISVSFEGTKK
jgi:polyisoprenoid-binding protein YceI